MHVCLNEIGIVHIILSLVLSSATRFRGSTRYQLPALLAAMDSDSECSPTWVSRPNKERKKRGTAGTFKGRRPPKNPIMLRAFEAERKKYHQHLKQKKCQPTPKQQAYWDRLRAKLRGPGSVESKRTALSSPQKRLNFDQADVITQGVPEFESKQATQGVPEFESKQAGDKVPELASEGLKTEDGIEDED